MNFIELNHSSYRVGLHVGTINNSAQRAGKIQREKSGEKELLKLMLPPLGKNWEYLPSGKPFFPNSTTDLSLSHSENLTVCQLSDSIKCGIDIQHFREKIIRVKDKFLNEKELNFVQEINEGEQVKMLTAMWSCKEVLFKMYGTGFIDYINLFTIHPFVAPDGIIKATADLGDGFREYYFRLFLTTSFALVFHHGFPNLEPDDIIRLPHF